MPGVARSLTLPRGWPRRVRSAAVHAISLADFALTTALGWAALSLNPRLRLWAEIERLQQEIQLLREEIRIKDARMQHIEAQKRPHYPPTTRLAILELRAARGWSLAQAARTFFVTPATIASWTARVDEEGPDAIVRLSEPVNKFPDFVGYLVRHLKILCLTLGKVKIDQILARAGSTSVPRQCAGCCGRHDRRSPARLSRQLLATSPPESRMTSGTSISRPCPPPSGSGPRGVPSPCLKCGRSAGGWPLPWITTRDASWASPSSAASPPPLQFREFLERLFQSHQPQCFVSDQGSQFTAREFKRWCRRRGIPQRFGAIGKYGSLVVIERCIRTIKHECTRRLILVPYRFVAIEQELALYVSWYNGHRPHSRLGAATPDEVYHHRRPAAKTPRFEPRPRWPRRSPCASPQSLIRGQSGVALDIAVRYHAGRRHLPIVTLKRAA